MSVPSDESWAFFMRHHDDIRSVCASYLPVRRMEVPNTRVMAGDRPAVREDTGEEVRDSKPLDVTHTIEDFDEAVKVKDSVRLTAIMNRAWLALPESRGVYEVPGVTEMCALLDCTVDGFFEDPDERRDEEDTPEDLRVEGEPL